MANRNLLLYLLAFLPLSVSAQKLTIAKSTVDVGRTGWKQPVTAVFELKAKGKVSIEAVQPDCNCTVVDYPKGTLTDKFQIRMTYDAKQLGHFDKQAAIKTNASSKPFYIRMKGQVLEDYIDLSADYPVEMGGLRIDKNYLEFADANKGDQLIEELKIYNNGTKTCHPILMHLPSYLTATVTPEELRPGKTGKITVHLNSSKLHDFGLTQSSVYLGSNPGDKVRQDHEIGLSVVLLPPFAGPVQNPPVIRLSKEKVDISFEGKKKKTEVIDITNSGLSELKITSMQMFTRGLRVALGKSRLQPGESTKLKVTAIRDELKRVRTRPRILMITNDPEKAKVTIEINAQ